ncbi:MAG: HAMP domain-containing histidine kinase [Proteobacteria bacterium]|nr:HAMP domain-containing histidine kinase [Cystobacterineae bacterium]MCL2258382.1 HAMP domain-containing histidine kinase [Cystobacterineae bacterium]MCL2315106.1 HAMP domain-containing histidine kinase [Pseudomonadota bacterium]
MAKRKSRSLLILVAVMFAVIGLIAYFGFRTLEHEVLLRHYQAQTLAQTRIVQAGTFVMSWFEQRAARFDAMMELTAYDDSAMKAIVARDDDIDSVFVLQKNRLLYPDERYLLTQKEQDWVRLVMPIVHDPSLLYSHNIKSEQQVLLAGWFVVNETQEPVLIYWRNKGGDVVGFRVSYIKLLSDIINAADFDFGDDTLQIKENGRLLYQSKPAEQLRQREQLGVLHLPYPLSTWQIEYYSQPTNTLVVYGWGGLFLLALMVIAGLIVFRFYREYTQTARLAQQQVGFVSQVSHELKTPLTNISLYAELLKEDLSGGSEEGLRYAEVIVSESKRLSRLIQNILTFTRAPKLNIQPIELHTFIRQIADGFMPSFQAKKMSIVVKMPQQITINSDVDRLTQIISNFLSNAEKYAAAGKRVELTVERQPEYVDIALRDYGVGIPEKEVKMIFQPFYRVKSAITEGVAGTGIGLTIARQLAESLGGEILVKQTMPGVQFILRLKQGGQPFVLEGGLE